MSRAKKVNQQRPAVMDKALRLQQAANVLRLVEEVGEADDDFLSDDGEQLIGAIRVARQMIMEVIAQLKVEQQGKGGAS